MCVQLKCNLLLWILPGILFVAGVVIYVVMAILGLGSNGNYDTEVSSLNLDNFTSLS